MTAPNLQPTQPNITPQVLLKQFWLDIYGKEVQSTPTYSYVWMADQMGHICLGLLIASILIPVAQKFAGLSLPDARLVAFFVTAAIVSFWEFNAYRTDVKKATGLFPLGQKLLRDNAIIAAGYMVIGAAAAVAFRQDTFVMGALILVALIVLSIVLAPRWLRQKIVWQRAGLLYLFRLADSKETILKPAAQALQALVTAATPPETGAEARQVVLAGPIGSGRTSLAAGIGTEFAFRGRMVRYLGFDELLEFATGSTLTGSSPVIADDSGPANVGYWPWCEAQVLIVDDVGPVIGRPDGTIDFTRFAAVLAGPLSKLATALSTRHTVWVLGDLQGVDATATLDKAATMLSQFCSGANPLAILLASQQVVAIHGPEAAAVTVAPTPAALPPGSPPGALAARAAPTPELVMSVNKTAL